MSMKQGTILIVDDNRAVLTSVRILLDGEYRKVLTSATPTAIPSLIRSEQPDVVLLDMNFRSGINTGNEGLFWLREIKRMRAETQVVLFTAYADIDLAVRGIKEGAADFIVKPFDNERLKQIIADAYHNVRRAVKPSSKAESGNGMYWGESPAMQDLRLMTEKVAPTDANILITGENGTGKEVLAREIHRLSKRSSGPLTTVDLGAVSESLFESELFGYVKGAFTDAKNDHAGKFEQAAGGTLFLDEIGNLSYPLQAKLLTALQRRAIVRVGGISELPIDVRLISATNKDLGAMVSRGEFREDLLYRVNTIRLHLPPLRERKADIVPLARLFLKDYAEKYGREGLSLSSEAELEAENMTWAGNIRELQHAVEKAVILADGDTINHLAPDHQLSANSSETAAGIAEAQTLDDMERQMIMQSIDKCKGNLSQVAQRLGISRQTLYNKIKKYGL